jgi:hypothetical protein
VATSQHNALKYKQNSLANYFCHRYKYSYRLFIGGEEMEYIRQDGELKAVISLRELHDLVDELRMFTMPPVLAGLERLDAPIKVIARQLDVTEGAVSHWKTGKVKLTPDRQLSLCNILARGIKLYEEVLAGYKNDNIKRPFYEIDVLRTNIESARKLLNIQQAIIDGMPDSRPTASKRTRFSA